MNEHINYICQRIEVLSPMHSKKAQKRTWGLLRPAGMMNCLTLFFEKYIGILAAENKTLDYSIACYLQMIADVNAETFEFLRTGKYTSSTFEEVNNRVYANPETMEYYMHGLLLSQFLWKHHYQMFDYFTTTLPCYAEHIKNYLEVGVGHGFYLSRKRRNIGR